MSIEKIKTLAKQEAEQTLKQNYETKIAELNELIDKLVGQKVLEHNQLALLVEKREQAVRNALHTNFDAEFAKMKNNLENQIAVLQNKIKSLEETIINLESTKKTSEIVKLENEQLRNELIVMKTRLNLNAI